MSTPQTLPQLKSKIDQEVTGQTAKNSITPTLLGALLKTITDFFVPATEKGTANGVATLDGNGKVPATQLPAMGGSGGSGTSSSIMRFPKDASLTTDHIGLLAMQQVTVLNNPPQSAADLEVKAVLCNTTPGTVEQKLKYKIELFGVFDLTNEQIQNNTWGDLLTFYFTTNSNQVGGCFLPLNYLFSPLNGNPYGTPDGDGILHFADNTEKENALNWVVNNKIFVGKDYKALQITSPFTYNPTTGGFECIVEATVLFDLERSTLWDERNYPPYHYTITTLTPQTEYSPEAVRHTILGTIVGVDGDEVLIDTAMVQTLKMASTADGAMWILPKTENFSNGMLVPWRNGTVIDYFSWTQIANIQGDANTYALASGTLFSALNVAAPDAEVTARFINMPLL